MFKHPVFTDNTFWLKTMDYINYTLEDFILDPFFSEWVLQPCDETNNYWQQWILAYPQKQDVVTEARMIIIILALEPKKMPPLVEQQMWATLKANMEKEN